MTQILNQHQSFLDQACDEDQQIPVDQLSGDEGMDKTIMMTFKNQSKANMMQTIVTVAKAIIGSGIISLPYTVSVMGWVLSIIIFLLVAMANQYSIYLLLKAKNLSKHSTYNSIAYHIYRSKLFQFFLSFINLFANIGFCVAMLSVLKGAIHKVLIDYVDDDIKEEFYVSQAFIAIVISILLAPAVLVKKVQKLRYIAVIGVFSILAAIIFMFILFVDEMSDRNWQNSFTMSAFPKNGTDMLSVFPNIMFALVYQSNFFSIYKGMKNSTDKKINIATASGVSFTIVLYIVLGLMGYCLFGSDNQYVKANFLLNLNKDQIKTFVYVGIYLGFLVCDLFCIPTTFLVSRNNMMVIIKMISYSNQKHFKIGSQQQIDTNPQVDKVKQTKKKDKIKFYIYTLILYSIFVIITILVQSLEAVFNIVGAIASSAISFIFPCLFYLLLVKKKKKTKNIHFYMSVGGIIIFIPLGILSIVSLYL